MDQAGDEIAALMVDDPLTVSTQVVARLRSGSSMRLQGFALLPLLAAAPPVSAQVSAPIKGWHLGAGVEAVRFGHIAISDVLPEQDTEVRPTSRPAFWISAGRAVGDWRIGLEAGWAGGHLEAANDEVLLQDLVSEVSRYRLALGIGRRIAAVGTGVVELAIVPLVDFWSIAGDGRVRAGAEARAVVRVPLGSVELENRIGIGVSGNPIEREDLGEASDLRGLRTFLVGIGLRLPI
jgi:hypothetical protein